MNIAVIEDKRKQRKVTVTELCKAVGIERSTYYGLLKQPERMKISTWDSIASYLGMTMAERKASLE